MINDLTKRYREGDKALLLLSDLLEKMPNFENKFVLNFGEFARTFAITGITKSAFIDDLKKHSSRYYWEDEKLDYWKIEMGGIQWDLGHDQNEANIYFHEKSKAEDWLKSMIRGDGFEIAKNGLVEYEQNYIFVENTPIKLGVKEDKLCDFLFGHNIGSIHDHLDAEIHVHGSELKTKSRSIENLSRTINKKVKPYLNKDLIRYENHSVRLLL